MSNKEAEIYRAVHTHCVDSHLPVLYPFASVTAAQISFMWQSL